MADPSASKRRIFKEEFKAELTRLKNRQALAQSSSEPRVVCAIPQVRSFGILKSHRHPFLRAYPSGLAARGISRTEFLEFMDEHNRRYLYNPVMKRGKSASEMLWIIGLLWVPILEPIGYVAHAALFVEPFVYAVRARRTRRAWNKNFFHPAGLHVTVVTRWRLVKLMKYPKRRLKLPPTIRDAESNDMSIYSRGARTNDALKGYAMALDYDIAEKPQGWKKIPSMEKHTRKKAKKAADRIIRRRTKANEKQTKQDILTKENRDVLEASRKALKEELDAAEREGDPSAQERIKKRLEEDAKRHEKKVRKHVSKGMKPHARLDKRDERTLNRSRWIVVTERNKKTEK